MKTFWNRLSPSNKVAMLSALCGLIVTAISTFSIALGYPGWTIGIAIGSIVGVFITSLLYHGSNSAVQEQKVGITIALYLVRVILLVAALAVPALLDFKMGIECMKYSTFGVGIGFIPSIIVLIIVMNSLDKEAE